MVEVAVATYGALTAFVLSGATRNRKLQRDNPRALEMVGYALCGCSATGSVLLLGYAAFQLIG